MAHATEDADDRYLEPVDLAAPFTEVVPVLSTDADDLPARLLQLASDMTAVFGWDEASADLTSAAARIRELTTLGDDLADFARGHLLDGPPLDAWDNR